MRVGVSFFLCLRAKFRGIPKALITKYKRETFYQPMGGIVISLKILGIGMGNRGYKSAIYYSIAVKEQRVYDSSVFIIL